MNEAEAMWASLDAQLSCPLPRVNVQIVVQDLNVK